LADPWIVLAAAALEVAAIGWPALWRGPPGHPVALLAAAINGLDAAWNLPGWSDRRRRALGIVTVVLVAGGAGLGGWFAQRHLQASLAGAALMAVLGAFGLAARSLYEHVADVSETLAGGDLRAARIAVGRIVGRDVDALDEGEIAAAALESLAESFNDGVTAPLFWFLVGGLGGLFAYKAVNTADSLVGHIEPPWKAFGWAAARTDDLMNLIPARIAGALIALVAGGGWRVMLRDAGKHASPNAGWPEAAMAGALGVRLGGPAAYGGVDHARPILGDGPRPRTVDLRQGLTLYRRACAALVLAMAAAGLAWPR
jgi:adenosylcobinamide-phosphate synthase